jgi:hypothetical protein
MTETVSPSAPMKRVEDWKSRLIDLSKRNNLLYLKKTGKRTTILPLTQPDPQKIFDSLVNKKNRLEFWLPPQEAKKTETAGEPKIKRRTKTQSVETEAKIAKAEVKPATLEEPKQPRANQLVSAKLTRQELERLLKNLERRSLLDYRERGVRILYAAFGTLNWVDMETNEPVQSPLILVPLELTRESIRKPYTIGVPPVEDEAVLNPALQAKLKNDYKIELPPLPEDWEEQTLADYYAQVNLAVANEKDWTAESIG